MLSGIISIPLSGQSRASNVGPEGDRGSHAGLPQFVVGPENRLVEVAVRSVFEDSLGRYNPLVLYGASGTGKSHLAHGLEAAWKARYHRRKKVQYTTAPDFARELADAIESQAVDDLQTKYRSVALLIVEDIGTLAGKLAAQTELVHTLDALLAVDSRVVLTASAAPADLPGILPALKSRLTSGLGVPLVPPGPEARLAILQRLASLRGIDLPESLAPILADGLSGTVPELLGALAQLEMAARLNGGRIDAATVQSLLAKRNGSRQPLLKDIAVATARYFALRLSDLRSSSRRRAVVTARGVAMYLARTMTQGSLEQIGRYFGGRDHTTVMHGCRKTENLLKSDPVIRQAVQCLQKAWAGT